MDYGFFMDFLWNGCGFKILKNLDFGMDMDLVSNPSGPTGSGRYPISGTLPREPTQDCY